MSARDRPGGTYPCRCHVCHERFMGQLGELFCTEHLSAANAVESKWFGGVKEALNVLADLTAYHCDSYGGAHLLADDAAAIAAVRLLAKYNRLVIEKDGEEWIEARWIDDKTEAAQS